MERDTVTSQNSVLQDKVDRLHRELDALQDMLKRIQRENDSLKKDKNYKGNSPDKRLQGIIGQLISENKQISDQRQQIRDILGDKTKLKHLEYEKRKLLADNIKLKSVVQQYEQGKIFDSRQEREN